MKRISPPIEQRGSKRKTSNNAANAGNPQRLRTNAEMEYQPRRSSRFTRNPNSSYRELSSSPDTIHGSVAGSETGDESIASTDTVRGSVASSNTFQGSIASTETVRGSVPPQGSFSQNLLINTSSAWMCSMLGVP